MIFWYHGPMGTVAVYLIVLGGAFFYLLSIRHLFIKKKTAKPASAEESETELEGPTIHYEPRRRSGPHRQ